MNYTFQVTYNSVDIEVHPLNWLECSLIDEQERDQIFYRRKFEGTLTFGGKKLCDDYVLFRTIQQVAPDDSIYLTIYKNNFIYCETYFNTSMGEWDYDNQTFTVTPIVVDLYTNWEKYGDDEYNILNIVPVVTTNIYGQAYTRNRWLTDVIEYLFQQIYPTAILVSWFLNNENNPVIGGVNQYRYLTIAQKSDIKRPNSSDPALTAKLNFNELMQMLKMYNLFWKWDGTTLRIEHYDYWQSTEGLDLRNLELSAGTNKYAFKNEDMPQYEKFRFMEANDTNYIEHRISYESPCVDGEKEYFNRVTTDLSYIIKCMADAEGMGLQSNISDEGFVILANYLQDGDYYVYFGTAYQNSIASYNYVNSWSYLLRAFFLHGRVLLEGKIQQTDIDFISTRRTKKQNISAIICSGYDPEHYITTELGEDYFDGQKASVGRATIKAYDQIDFELLYGEDTNEEAVMPERYKTLTCIIDTGWTFVTSILSEPNIYDTYYWVWFDDDPDPDACMEIMIPAGIIYQEDAITYIGPPSSAKFNISDPSLDGWYFKFYIDTVSQSYTVCFDEDCGNAEDPGGGGGGGGVPDPPVAISATQNGFCEPVDFAWNSSVGATYYKVFRKPNIALEDIWEFISNEAGTHYYDYDAGETGGYTFYYKVQACNINGCSADSNEVNCIVLC